MKEDLELIKIYPQILGIDEAGRGPWAGPVVMAGVLLKPDSPIIDDVNDSKKLTEKKRAILYGKITQTYEYKISIIESDIIDKIGIGNAVIKGMNEIISHFKCPYTFVDGYFKPGSFPIGSKCIIKGDSLFYSIGAASILAKYTRDQIMLEYDKTYPQYLFAKHKGYGTKEHEKRLQVHGASPIHRKSFKPIRLMGSSSSKL